MEILSNRVPMEDIPDLPKRYGQVSSYKKAIIVEKAEEVFGIKFSGVALSTLDVFFVKGLGDAFEGDSFLFVAVIPGSTGTTSPSGRVIMNQCFFLYELLLSPSDIKQILN